MSGPSFYQDPGLTHRVYGSRENASFQVIVLGHNGGPREDTVTGLLVRAPQAEWRKNSVIAVDAGAHLASIIRILQQHMPNRSERIPEPGYSKVLEEGPFAGIRFPHISARHNALYIFRDLLHAFLITHPHLDHLAAMAINTPALEYGREAKAIVALPSTIDAIKSHIFNDSIWPNLSDESHGVGLVTYRRLVEGGNPRLGTGEARGYVRVCDGLAAKCWSVSHGKCQRRSHSHNHSHQRGESVGWFANDCAVPPRRLSRISDDHGYFTAIAQQQAYGQGQIQPVPLTPGGSVAPSSAISIDNDHFFEPVTSAAFFIRNEVTGQEIVIFGDTEPDSLSISPRNHVIWNDAAAKVANGSLKAIFIECSFDDATRDQDLYGHLCPRHVVAELKFLANCVMNYRDRTRELSQIPTLSFPPPPPAKLNEALTKADLVKKRKREINGDQVVAEVGSSPQAQPLNSPATTHYVGRRSTSRASRRASHGGPPVSPAQRPLTPSKIPRHVQFSTTISLNQAEIDSGVLPMAATAPSPWCAHAEGNQVQPSLALPDKLEKLPEPLRGLHVHIIHVKDTLLDGPSAGSIILEQLRKHASNIDLGCEFDVTDCGESIWI